MTDMQVISAILPESAQVKLSTETYEVKPLTIRRMAKLAAMLKDVQGNPERFKDPSGPEFHGAVADMLIAAGDKMPAALALLTGDDRLAHFEDIVLHDLAAIVEAAATVNKPALLVASFRRAMDALNGKADQK